MRYPAIGGAKIAKIAVEEYTIESVIRGHHIYIKSIWHPILGEQLTLERGVAMVMTDIRHLDRLLQRGHLNNRHPDVTYAC